MKQRELIIILYDYYGELLGDDNRKYFEDYYFDNLSLAEIAENDGVSRNAIHKHIKSCEEKLTFFESKLKLYEKDKKIKEKLSKLNEKDKEMVEKIIFND